MAICICHQQKRLIVVKKGYCKQGNDEQKNKKKTDGSNGIPGRLGGFIQVHVRSQILQRNALCSKTKRTGRKPKKSTGELEIFKSIYEERGPYSQISGQWIPFDVRCFSHVLSKGSYPSLRLEKRNIILKTAQEHDAWHTQRHKLKHLPEWQWFFELEQQLKQEYYELAKKNFQQE